VKNEGEKEKTRENVGIFKNKTFILLKMEYINQQKCNKYYTDMTSVLSDAVAKKSEILLFLDDISYKCRITKWKNFEKSTATTNSPPKPNSLLQRSSNKKPNSLLQQTLSSNSSKTKLSPPTMNSTNG
jgi:hypothetical protein